MTSKPWKRQTGTKPKIKRGAGQISREEAKAIRAELEEIKKRYPKNTVQMPPVYGQGSTQQRVSQTQPAQQANPLNNWWRAIVIIAIVILAAIFVYNLVLTIGGGFNWGGSNGGGNDCTCYCGNGKVCTSNSQCPADTSVSGTYVPGVCGCPVGC